MTTPNRWEIVGNCKVVAKVKVLDKKTNEEFDGELRFTGEGGIETIDRENVNANFKVIEDEESKSMWELVVFDQQSDNNYDDDILTTLGLTNNQLVKYAAKLQQTTKHSSEQVHNFIKVLVNRFNKLGITSLQELFIRCEKIHAININEILKEVAGVYHLNNLQALINILVSEKKSKEYIEHYNKLIEKEQEKQSRLDNSSEDYRLSVENELRWLNNKKLVIEKLI
jgi:hypothetical protein